MLRYLNILPALGFGLVSQFGFADAATSGAVQGSITAIDVALEPDATMMDHVSADNARLLKNFPKGFALDETHHAHVTVLQRFVALRISTRCTLRSPVSWKKRTRPPGS
jgi:hypothetical protein